MRVLNSSAVVEVGGDAGGAAKLHHVEDVQAYQMLGQLPEKKLDALIDVLVVELVTAHLRRPTPLGVRLAEELKVNVRAVGARGEVAGGIPEHPARAPGDGTQGAGTHTGAGTEEERACRAAREAVRRRGGGEAGRQALAAKVNAWMPVNFRKAEAQH